MAKPETIFSKNIKRLLGQKTQSEVARLAGMKPQQFSDTLSSEDPRVSTLERIAKALGVPLAELFREGEPVDQPDLASRVAALEVKVGATFSSHWAKLDSLRPKLSPEQIESLVDTANAMLELDSVDQIEPKTRKSNT